MASGTYYIDTNVNPGTSTIQVGSGCDIAHQKLQAEIDDEIARAKAREDEIESKIEGQKVNYFVLPTPDGEFSDEVFDLLISNNLNQLVYDNCRYSLGFKNKQVRRYITPILEQGCQQYIEVNILTKEWHYELIGNEALIAHIRDTKCHVTPAEKDFWNNKVTCKKQGELLIFSKSKL